MNPDTDCLACDGKRPVNWLLTRLNPSATVRVCQEDVPIALVSLLATELEVDAGWLQQIINDGIEGLGAEVEAAEQQAGLAEEAENEAATAPYELSTASSDE